MGYVRWDGQTAQKKTIVLYPTYVCAIKRATPWSDLIVDAAKIDRVSWRQTADSFTAQEQCMMKIRVNQAMDKIIVYRLVKILS